ncbi:MAG: hypothetical protein HY606_03740 [Planctomycetes bacterium]|nr:hypothetical protein [Planctomycetota bacterium]
MKYFLFASALILCSCGGSGAAQLDKKYEPIGEKELEKVLNEVRTELKELPVNYIEWENIIDRSEFGLVRQMTVGYEHIYIETERIDSVNEKNTKRRLLIISRRTKELDGGYTKRIINLDLSLKWGVVENSGVPQELERLRRLYAEVRADLDRLFRTQSQDVNEIARLKRKRDELFEQISKSSEEDNFYFISGHHVYCYQRNAPYELKWSKDFYFVPGANPFIAGNYMFLVGIRYARVFVISSITGEIVDELRPNITTQNRIFFTPVAKIPYVYFSSEEEKLISFDISKHSSPVWSYDIGAAPSSSPYIVQTSTKLKEMTQNVLLVLVGSKDSSLYAINGISGSKVWQYRCESEPTEEIVKLSNNTILVKTQRNYIINLDLFPIVKGPEGEPLGPNSLGKFNWQVPGAKKFILETQNFVLIETNDGNLRQIDKVSGRLIKNYKGTHITSFAQNIYDDILYAVSDKGLIFALKNR